MRLVYAQMSRVSRRMRQSLAAVLLITVVSVSAGCGSSSLDGRVSIVGSTTLLPMMSEVAGSFGAENPLATMRVRMAGTGDGAGLFCDGLVWITAASRALSDRELESCAAANVTFVRLKVADDAVVLFTPDDAALPTCLTTEQIYALMGPESAAVTTWRAANSIIPGSGDSLPDSALNVIGPGSGAGTKQVLLDLVIGPIAKERDQAKMLRGNYQALISEQLIPSATRGAVGGLGFVGLPTLSQESNGLRPLGIDEGDGCVVPTVEHVHDETYPLGRPLYLYVNLEAAESQPTLKAFVDSVLSDAGLAAAATTGGISLDRTDTDTVRQHWQDALATGKGDAT